MGYFRKTLKYGFVAANIVAGAGAFEAANRTHDNPNSSTEDLIETILMRPLENYDRTIQGQFASASSNDMAIDAAITRTIGNRLNDFTDIDDNKALNYSIRGVMALPAAALAPATWAGGLAGTAVGAIGLHFDD